MLPLFERNVRSVEPSGDLSLAQIYQASYLKHLFERLNFCHKRLTFLLLFNIFGIIKHLLDRTSPDILFVVQIETDVGLSFASSNISLNLHNK